MKGTFRKIAKICLFLVYLVIVAGAVVRVTGSGMGCPDWPRCYGYYIPPTEASEVEWKPAMAYAKGQAIIVEEKLYLAKKDFTTGSQRLKENWKLYTKHDYAVFNPIHTWIEYINRLVTVVLGLPMLALFFLSFKFYKKDKIITFVTVLTMVILGIQAVLGKLVVDTNLKPTMISVHMLIALLLMAMLIYLIYRTGYQSKSNQFDKTVMTAFILALIASLAQIVLGIQVRQFVDLQIDQWGRGMPDIWLTDPSWSFYIHRSFSILVVALNSFIAYRIFKHNLGYTKIKWVLTLLSIEVITGIVMYYFDFPRFTQPSHLVLASLLFGVQIYLFLEAVNSQRSPKTL